MEEVPKPAVEAKDTNETAPKRKSNSIRGFFNLFPEWLGRRQAEEVEKSKDEKDDSPEAKKKSRFRRWFSKPFESLVKKEKIEVETSEKPSQLDTEPSPQRQDEFVLPTIETSTLPTPIAEANTVPDLVEVNKASVIEKEPLSEKEPDKKIEKDSVKIAAPEVPPPFTPIYERLRQQQETQSVEVETHSHPEIGHAERKGKQAAFLAFAGSELLSRRRDRKIRKEQSRQAKEQSQEIKEVKKTIEDYARVERAKWQQNAERPKYPYVEMPPISPERQQAYERPHIAERSTLKHERVIELQPKAVEQARDEAKRVIEAERKEANPNKILERVEKAAEKNVPLESLLERRHEVKDQSDIQKALNTSAATSASFDAGSGNASHHDIQAFQEAMRRQAQVDGSKFSNNGLYKRAAMSGFATGAVLMAVVAVIALLS